MGDGVYRLVLRSLDFQGNTSSKRVTITVDAHGPIASRVLLPRSHDQQLVVNDRDPVSGVARAILYVDGRRAGNGTHLLYRAPEGWTPGRHRFALYMLDRVGNPSIYRGSFTIPDPLVAAIRFARSRSGRVGFAIIDESGRLRGYHLDEGFRSASLIKAMLLVSYLRDLAGGRQALTAADRDTLRSMIEVSDNSAASTIYARVGDQGLARVAALSGMRNFTTLGYWGDNNLTAADQARFFQLLPVLVPTPYRAFAQSLLGNVVSWQRWGIPAVATGWHVYFKGGWKPTPGGFSTHQSAYLERRADTQRFVLVILTEGPDQSYGEQTISGITQRLLAAHAY